MPTAEPTPYKVSSGKATRRTPQPEEVEARVRQWLKEMHLGDTNPFQPWDAGADPNLSQYLVDHHVLDLLWHDSPTIVYAPAGGGKSAFRVRLAWACRVEEDQRRVFAISYVAPDPAATSLEAHLPAILRRAAQELLLALVHRPARFLGLSKADQESIRQTLDQNDPGLVKRFLPQLERVGGVGPLAESFDPSAAHLTKPAQPNDVRALCSALAQMPAAHRVPPAIQRFEALLDLLLGVLGFQAVYLLVDGVDAWLETQRRPDLAVAVLAPLLEHGADWSTRQFFIKLFLPCELQKALPRRLTKGAQSAIIRWDSKSLAEVLRQRLSAASGGGFDSLDAISHPSLRGAEEELLATIGPFPTPRELLVLVNQIVVEHVLRDGQDCGLEPQDMQAAIMWYHSRARPFRP